MGRENRLTGGVFTEIVGTQDRISSYDRFLNVDIDLRTVISIRTASV